MKWYWTSLIGAAIALGAVGALELTRPKGARWMDEGKDGEDELAFLPGSSPKLKQAAK